MNFGLSSNEGAVFLSNIRLKDLFGRGINFKVTYRRSGIGERYYFGLSDDYFFSPHLFIHLSDFKDYVKAYNFKLLSKGNSLLLGYRLSPFTSLSFSYIPSRSTFKGKEYNLFKKVFSLQRKYSNEPINPTKVRYSLLEITYTKDYSKYFFRSSFLQPFALDYLLSFTLSLGLIRGKPPPFEEFYLGGFRDLRGYDLFSLGGGKSFSFLRLDLYYRFKRREYWGLLSDFGLLEGKGGAFDFGLGYLAQTPLGNLHFQVAYAKRLRFYLYIGALF